MFKKVELWVLGLICIIFIIVLMGYGSLLKHGLAGGNKFPHLYKVAVFIAEVPKNFKDILITFRDPYHDLSIKENIHANKPRFKKFIKINRKELLLVARFDADLGRSIVEIVDLNNFTVLHTFKPNIKEINNQTDINREEFNLLNKNFNEKRYNIYHPLLDTEGNLLFHGMYTPLSKINFCSELVWVNDIDNFHHSNNKDDEGNYWIPSIIFPHSIDKNLVGNRFGEFRDDAITKISSDGKILYQKSVSKILLDNNLDYLIFGQSNFFWDPIHLNDIQPTLNDGKYWKKNDIFLSLRNLSMIIHFRPSTDKIINILTGPFYMQHDIDIISEKEISIFNNNAVNTQKGNKYVISNNQILIYNFDTENYTKRNVSGIKENNVKTATEGVSDFLKDGSLMIEDGNSGRILFFNSNGKLEWEFINKAKNGKVYPLSWARVIQNDLLIKNTLKKIENNQCK